MNEKINSIIAGLRKGGAIMDVKMEFSDYQTLTAMTAGVNAAGSTLDIGDAYQQFGTGGVLYLNVNVAAAFTSGATLFYVWLMTSADDSTYVTAMLLQAPFSALATIGAYVGRAALPASNLKRYIKILYGTDVKSGTVIAAGSVNAWIGLDAPKGRTDTVQWGWTA